jgi:hypothetical protein
MTRGQTEMVRPIARCRRKKWCGSEVLWRFFMGIPRHYGHAKILGWIAIVGICILSHKDPMISLIFITIYMVKSSWDADWILEYYYLFLYIFKLC